MERDSIVMAWDAGRAACIDALRRAVARERRGDVLQLTAQECVQILETVSLSELPSTVYTALETRETSDQSRVLNDDDLLGFARRIAFGARQSLENRDSTWIYLPSFNEAVIAEAHQMLKTVVQHERQMAADRIAAAFA